MFSAVLRAGTSGFSLLLVPCWPLLAGFLLLLLPRDQTNVAGRFLAASGLVVAALFTPFMPEQDVLSDVVRLLAASIPFLAWRDGLGRAAAVVPFFATSCVMLALTVHQVLAVVALLGLASAFLALYDAAGAVRARSAWETAQLRVAGVMMALLGATFTTLSATAVGSGTLRTGDLLLSVGLCLIAGLGHVPAPPPAGRPALLDILPRLGASALMLRLPAHDVTDAVFLALGLVTLWLCAFRQRAGGALFAAMMALCAGASGGGGSDRGMAAESPVLVAGLLFCIAATALATERIDDRQRAWMETAQPPSPLFMGSLLLLAELLPGHPLMAALILGGLGLQVARAGPGDWPRRMDRADLMFWGLVLVGLLSPLLLLWPLALAWHPS
ncbi:hypothetical protein [Brytella acorum]|uniref:Uncharacterized protein n=1 Tax=Brytella acorum TaxID=2959299 RepID=A0AA35VBT5_9PROT|nr:hypothetical protein [Brytella acorum]MDF3623510.1 hypothetical protein [Brytella acorum]CAI9121357.1 hypothetical protein LMG32879_002204 [Brytella acorum]